MITTHLLDITEAQCAFKFIDEGDPLVIPLVLVLKVNEGDVLQVNEFDLPSEVVTRQRASMIAYWRHEGKEEEIRHLLEHYGMRICSWMLPAGAEIRDLT